MNLALLEQKTEQPLEPLSHKFVILDTNNSQEIAEYEKAFFEAFIRTDNQLIHKIWDWDYAEKRVKTRIPYVSQINYAVQDNNGSLLASVSINTDPTNRQFTKLDLKVEDLNKKSVEAFAMFMRPNSNLSIFQLINFLQLAANDLANRGFDSIYAICPQRIFNIYRRIGFRILETKIINGETRHFIKLNCHS